MFSVFPNSKEEGSTSELDSCSAGRDILRLLRNTNVQYPAQKNSPPDPILMQFNPVHKLIPCPKFIFNIVLPSTHSFSKWTLPSGFTMKM
jgi:hypothetical protein